MKEVESYSLIKLLRAKHSVSNDYRAEAKCYLLENDYDLPRAKKNYTEDLEAELEQARAIK